MGQTAPHFGQMIVECTQEMMARWHPNTEVDVATEMTALARRIIGKALLSVDVENEAQELAVAIAVRQRYIRHVYETVLPFAEHLPTRINRECRHAVRFIDQTFYEMIAARRRDPSPPPDLLTLFINARYSDGSHMTDKQVRDEALTVTSTGYETIALALAWTMYLLAQHPAAQRQLAEEAYAALDGRAPTADDVPKLRYTEMVFLEAMRLYPPAWIFVRVPEQDDVLPSGVPVRAGTKLYLCPYVTHRDARFFPEPDRFQPERFTEACQRTRPRFAYFPFAGGPRVCLGQGFALLEGILVLACIARRFTWAPVPGPPIEPRPGQFLFPRNEIRVRLNPCSSGERGA
jgi:cytochrome P450